MLWLSSAFFFSIVHFFDGLNFLFFWNIFLRGLPLDSRFFFRLHFFLLIRFRLRFRFVISFCFRSFKTFCLFFDFIVLQSTYLNFNTSVFFLFASGFYLLFILNRGNNIQLRYVIFTNFLKDMFFRFGFFLFE